jgi:hypothetical protein
LVIYSAFQIGSYQSNAYQVNGGSVVIPEMSGGLDYSHYAYNDPYNVRHKEVLEESIVQAETSLIDLRQRAQELRLKQLARQTAKDLREMAQLEASLKFIQEQIILESRNLLRLQNEFALLILIMSCPFLRIGGV